MDEQTGTHTAGHGDGPHRATPSEVVVPAADAVPAETPAHATAGDRYAECVLCRKPTEYPETVKGVTLCPVCEWQEAQRTACPG
ncbi:hypothetical protein [Streptomyces sp. NPDC014734]|uniref:hypothetical protein n=1 Tax=Streptomyces sp. NPDC014734 TaxID=3364886 RepID=UPI0036FA680A